MDQLRRAWARMPWWGWSCLALAASVAAGWIWFVGQWDLRRVERDARAAGLPWTQAELAKRDTDRATAATLQRVRSLQATITFGYIGYVDWVYAPSGVAEARKILSTYAATVASLERELDAIGESRAQIGADPFDRDGVDRYRIAKILAARLVTCDRTELDATAERAARFVRAMPGWAAPTCARPVIMGFATRIGELGGDVRAASALDGACDALAARVREDWPRLLPFFAGGLERPLRVERLCADAGVGLTGFESHAPSLVLPLEARAQRERVLRRLVGLLTTLRDHPDPSTWPTLIARPTSSGHTSCFALLMDTVEREARGLTATLLWSRLLVAEMRREPWPRDWFDPHGGTLRRIERDGRLIGAYSVGYDGRDDGGFRSQDLCWQLYDRLGEVRAADPAAPQP